MTRPTRRAVSRWALFLITLLLVAGATIRIGPQLGTPRALGGQTVIDPAYGQVTEPGHPVGQSFVARNNGLAGVEMVATAAEPATLSVVLYDLSDARTEVARTRVTVGPGDAPQRLRVSLDIPFFSDNQRYLVELEPTANTSVRLEGAGALSYVDGVRYLDGAPQEAQLRFMPLYHPWGLLFDLIALVGLMLFHSARYLLLFGLPGAAVLAWLAPERLRDARSGPMLAAISGVALLPVLYVAASVMKLPLNGVNIAILLVASAFLLAMRIPLLRAQSVDIRHTPASDLLLLLILLLVVGSRFAAIDGLEGPSWGDAIQHAVISQRLTEARGLFEQWLPYAPYQSQTTHFGFSAAVAASLSLYGGSAVRETLLVGQWLNVLAILALYPLALRVTGRPWAATAALLVAGLLSPMPSMYVNWSRYAQLAGQVVMPLAMLLLLDLTDPPRQRVNVAALLGLVLAGMALCYYRMPIYFAWFALAWALLYALPRWRFDLSRWQRGILHGVVAGTALVLPLIPWAARLRDSRLMAGAERSLTVEPVAANVWQDYRLWREISQFVPVPLLALVAVALVVALVRPRRWPWLILFWTLLLAGSRATHIFRFPLANYLQSFAILIMLYLPVALLIGWLVGEIVERLRSPGARAALAALLAILAIGGGVVQGRVARPDFAMLTRPDLVALEWLSTNLPPDATVLVNGYTIYNDTSFVGADAGWWLPLIAHRANTVPPQYAVLNERANVPSYTTRMLDLILALRDADLSQSSALDPLCGAGITHLYLGQREGMVGLATQQLLQPEELDANPNVRLIHREDAARLYELLPTQCR